MSSASLPARTISMESALAAVAAAQRRAADFGRTVGVAVVDPAGSLVASARMDGAPTVALELAAAKAWTAAAFDSPSEALREASKPAGELWGFGTTLSGRLCLLPGGLPLADGGQPIGAIGVSGATGDEDRACAEAGAGAIGP